MSAICSGLPMFIQDTHTTADELITVIMRSLPPFVVETIWEIWWLDAKQHLGMHCHFTVIPLV